MMILRRTLSASKLKNLFNAVSVSSDFTSTNPVSSYPYFTQNPAKAHLPLFFFLRDFCSESTRTQSLSRLPMSRDGNYDDSTAQNLKICPGCGVSMQDSDPKQPGYFIVPIQKSSNYKPPIDKTPIFEESEISDSLKKGFLDEDIANENDDSLEIPDKKLIERPIVCARCHNLRHYGKVKDPSIENLLPDFDFDHTVGRRLASTTGARTVVMMVVDASDFDGSFPKKVANLVSEVINANSSVWKEGKSGNVPRILLVVSKIDLLPSTLSPTRLEHWVRTRARENGMGRLTSVHFVSAIKDWGVKNLVDDVIDLAGPRGQVWAIGAQNAGKSTLINAIGKSVGGDVSHLTEAPVPGTTLGILRVEGVLPGKAKLFDTPGLLHPHQISTRLTRKEQRLINISKELKPRTYRIKVGHSIHIGGLVRLDIEDSPLDSLYITVWASPLVPLHMGKIENAKVMLDEHFGLQLQPPIGQERVEKLGKWVRKEFHVSGSWWDSSSVDIAVSGLGWFAIGLRGNAVVGVWTYDGVEMTIRDALLPQRSHNFLVAGFTTSDIVSEADRASNNNRKNGKRRARDSSAPKNGRRKGLDTSGS